ncbi:MAG: sugar ABC transporter permease [Candidatus Thermoplasmatota archaeon]|jgi:arabinogalactan oligomer/maltooligosaccharide transport system permease protein|nr:sugar ABC transporter permease [Candidatus Thermoplasmatota archaeon]
MTERAMPIKNNNRRIDFKSLLWILPVLIVLAFLDFYPILEGIYFSLTDFNQFHFFNYGFVGFANYSYIFGSPELRTVIANTLVWSVGSTVVMVPAGFMLALIMNQKNLRGKYIYRSLYLFPWAFPAFLTILVWSNMLAYNGGVVNDLLGLVGISSIAWLTSPTYAMFSIIFVNFWLSFPYYTFVYTSAVQSIPNELYEAAEMDGYGSLRTLTRVTLPLLKRQVAFITIFGFIFTWNNFYVPFLLTGGGPGISTQILITYSYLEAFSYSNYALGAAYAIISILILLVFVIVTNHYTKMMSILY